MAETKVEKAEKGDKTEKAEARTVGVQTAQSTVWMFFGTQTVRESRIQLGRSFFRGWFWDDQEAGGAQLAHRHVFGFKSGVKGNMHFTDDAHLLQHDRAQGLGPDQKEFPTL